MSVNEVKRLVFHMKVPSLKEMCSYAIGLEYLRGEVAKYNSSKVKLFCFYQKGEEEGCIHFVNANLKVNLQMERIPKHVKEMIDQYVESLKVEIEDWLNHHFYQVFWFFSGCHHASAVAYLNDLIWLPNGTIDYTETARKLLHNNELTQSEKYWIACAYCFEEEIYTRGPLYYMNLSNEEIASHDDFLDQFWYKRVQKKISNEELPSIDYHHQITNGLLQSLYSYKNWWAVKYFLNNLQPDEVVDLTRNACCTDLSAIQMLYWLPTLDGALACKVLNACGYMLVQRLIRHPKYSIPTLQIWSYLKSTISEVHFLNLINGIHFDNDFISRYGKSDDGSVILYNEILKSTPDELKYSALGLFTDTYYSCTFQYHSDSEECPYMEFPRDFRMIFVMLFNASFEHRNKFWNNNWKNLLWGSTPFHLNKLMRLCFYDEMEIIKFKESDLIVYDNIKNYCVDLVKKGKFTELDIFLNFCSSNEQTVFDLRRKIMHDPLRLSDSVKQYKDGEGLVQYVSSFWSQFEFVQNVLNDNELLLAKKFVILFSFCEQDLCRWKKILVESLHTHLVEKEFTKIISITEWKQFIDWLFDNNGEKVLEFKKSLPKGEIFVGSLLSRSPHELNKDGSSFMSHFLRWYLKHPEIAENYLLIKNCLDLSMQQLIEVYSNTGSGYITAKKKLDKFNKCILKACFSITPWVCRNQ